MDRLEIYSDSANFFLATELLNYSYTYKIQMFINIQKLFINFSFDKVKLSTKLLWAQYDPAGLFYLFFSFFALENFFNNNRAKKLGVCVKCSWAKMK